MIVDSEIITKVCLCKNYRTWRHLND